MAIPDKIRILNGELPPRPGVYFMRDTAGELLYIGKATSLRTRVGSYFQRPQDARISAMVAKIGRIDWQETPTAVEALILEANLIKKFQPPYNVMEKDDKSWTHLAFTREPFPRPVFIRGHELARAPKRQFLKTFGPFRSAGSVQAALDALRRSFPWTTCRPGRNRPCFYRHLKLCPGVCDGTITSAEYVKIIRGLMRIFGGGRSAVVRDLKREMAAAAKAEDFERAATLRDRLYQLDHIRDMAVMKREDRGIEEFIDIFGRIEGYDVSNIGGQDAVVSLVVFEDGRPKKSAYRKFRIRTVEGPNDVAMLAEVIRRRFSTSHQSPVIRHQPLTTPNLRTSAPPNLDIAPNDDPRIWPKPDLLLIDGGSGQLNAVRHELVRAKISIPLVGIAKGPDRKQDELVYDKRDHELARLVQAFKPVLQQVRDEAHRFAVGYHRKLRAKRFLGSTKK